MKLRRHAFLVISGLLWGILSVVLLVRMVNSAQGQDSDIFPEEHDAEETIQTDWSDYLLPLDIEYDKTSTFGEYRRTHFHEGIDLGTQGRTGLPVRATRAGEVLKAVMDPGGYGWKLTLRHKDGFRSVYAHLEGFSEKILMAYHRRLMAEGKSFGEVEFERGTVEVRKGEVIARSGETGAGGPHLHFEIRDADDNPVNPELAPRIAAKDGIAPVPRELLFIPMDGNSSVNGKYAPLRISIVGDAKTGYRVTDTVSVRGRIGMALRAEDRREGSPFSWTPYSIITRVNGKSDFVAVQHLLLRDRAWLIHVDRDQDFSSGSVEFRKLYRDPGNPLPIYRGSNPEAGLLSSERFGEGIQHVEIHARDLARNGAKVSLRVKLGSTKDLRWEVSNGTPVAVTDLRSAATLKLSGVTVEGRWDVLEHQPLPAGSARREVPQDLQSRYHLLKAEIIDPDGTASPPNYLRIQPGPAGEFTLTKTLRNDEIRYRMVFTHPPDIAPEIAMDCDGSRSTGQVRAETPTLYHAVLRSDQRFRGQIQVTASARFAGRVVRVGDSFEAFHIDAKQGGWCRSRDGKFSMIFAPGDVYRSMLVTVKEHLIEGSEAYSVEPQDIPLSNSPEIRLQTRGFKEPGVYLRGNPRLGAVRNEVRTWKDATDSSLRTRLGRELRSYTVAKDGLPPVITFSQRGRNGDVLIRMRDGETALDLQSITITVNGEVKPVDVIEANPLVFVLRRGTLTADTPVVIQASGKDVLGNLGSERLELKMQGIKEAGRRDKGKVLRKGSRR